MLVENGEGKRFLFKSGEISKSVFGIIADVDIFYLTISIIILFAIDVDIYYPFCCLVLLVHETCTYTLRNRDTN